MSKTSTTRKALGRGLSALIPGGTPKPGGSPATGGVLQLPVAEILPNPLQPRRCFREEGLAELAASVREHGILQPVIVSRSNGQYHLVVGERRWRAAQAAGLSAIPAIVRELVGAEGLEVALIENVQREDLNALEEALAYQYLMREHGMTQEDVAARVGKSRSAVANTLRLLNLPEPIQQDVESGAITPGHARALLSVEGEALRRKVWARIKQAHLSVRQTEAYVRALQRHPEQPEAKPRRLPPDWLDVEESLQHYFSVQVKIRPRGRQAGRIEIHYASPDELDRVLETLMGRRYRRGRSMAEDLV